ncbi:MAG: protein kinase, partial [Proteobacteria bacterium]|nr:protein kinase [Pseudomonadota bacterium]
MNMTVPGYKIEEELFSSHQTLIYRALRKKDKTSVIIKTLNTNYPSNREISHFKHESHVIRQVEGEGVIRIYEEIKYANNLALIQEDIEGASLKEYLKGEERLELERLLNIGIDIVKGLGQIHRQNVIHKDINPNNIIFNQTTNKLQIIDFGVSTELSREQ